MRVIVTRPAAAAAATAARLAALGHEAIVLPLFDIVPAQWTPPAGEFDAVLLTSAAAAGSAGSAMARYMHVPCYCVGEQTAAAARAAGFADVRVPPANGVAELLERMVAAGIGGVLHLSGRDVVDVAAPASLRIERRAVYDARPRDWSAAEATAAAHADVALLYSPRAARRFAEIFAANKRPRLRIAALSRAVADAAGSGWAGIAVAGRPDENALFAAAARLCDKQP